MVTSNRPKVSVCCLCYNHEKYIRDALDGFVMQKTLFPYEVLVHDDASTDHSLEILDEYQKKYPGMIRLLDENENQLSKGKHLRDLIYPFAQGDYIALCEGDDFWTDRSKLQAQVDYLDAHPDYTACFHKAVVVSECGLGKEPFRMLKEGSYTSDDILLHWTIPTASFMFRRSFYNKIPNDKRFIYDDIVEFLTMAEYGPIYCIERNMSVYRRHSDSIIGNQNKNKDISLYERLDGHYSALGEHFTGLTKRAVKWMRLKNQVFKAAFILKRGMS